MAKYLPDLPAESKLKFSPTNKPSLPTETRRKFALTQELFSRSVAAWDDLENTIQCSGRNIDEWIAVLKQTNSVPAFAYAGYLDCMKKHIENSKNKKTLEQSQQTFLKRIPASRLIRRV